MRKKTDKQFEKHKKRRINELNQRMRKFKKLTF
jgi:hypothetical protein